MACHGDAPCHDNYRSILKLACPWWPSPFAVLSGTWRASALNANDISSWSNSPVYLDRWTLPSFLAYAWVLVFALLRHTPEFRASPPSDMAAWPLFFSSWSPLTQPREAVVQTLRLTQGLASWGSGDEGRIERHVGKKGRREIRESRRRAN